jgi:molybdopterin converting factor small subunit
VQKPLNHRGRPGGGRGGLSGGIVKIDMSESATVSIYVPRELRKYCDGSAEVSFSGRSVRAVLEEVERRHPSLYLCICDETGMVRRHVNLFVNTSHVRDLQGLDTLLKPGDELIVLPAVSGG